MSMCSLLLCCWKEGLCYNQWVLLAKLLLAFDLLHFVLQTNLPITPGISWLCTFAFQSPEMKRISFWVLVLEGLVGLHRTIQLQLLQHYCLGHRLGLLWYWMVCLGNEQRSFCRFWDCIQESFVCYDGYSISSKGFLPTVVDVKVIWIKFMHPSPL